MSHTAQTMAVHYHVPRSHERWELSEETMPESVLHDEAVELLKALLKLWASRVAGTVARNLAIRWDESNPKIGIDPDVCVLVPAPQGSADLRSVRTWLPGHEAPVLAVEVVSETNPHKDYSIAPDKYAASGVGELWIFDPLRCGPALAGGPFRLQIWHRAADDTFTRIYAGEGPARSPSLDAYLVPSDEGRKLRIASDPGGTDLWLTPEEAERAAKERALARVAELEAELARRG